MSQGEQGMGTGLPTLQEAAAKTAAGDLDPTFGTGGIVTTDITASHDYATCVAIQPDGTIVAAGCSRI